MCTLLSSFLTLHDLKTFHHFLGFDDLDSLDGVICEELSHSFCITSVDCYIFIFHEKRPELVEIFYRDLREIESSTLLGREGRVFD